MKVDGDQATKNTSDISKFWLKVHFGKNSTQSHTDYVRANKPIPASYFPQSLTVEDATQELPDIFHIYRDTIVFSERARA